MIRLSSSFTFAALLGFIAFSIPVSGFSSETVVTQRAVTFADGSGATSKVKSECTLETRLPEFIQQYAKGVDLQLSDNPEEMGADRVLYLEISNVIGGGGGAWSGAKSVSVKGQLKENGEVIGSFNALRYSGGGAFGGFKGTCSILGRCIKALGKDIGKWLGNPTMDAYLGDA